LLEYVVDHAKGCRVARAAGVQAEMELAFAGLHQLCVPMLDRLERLPNPQRDALGAAFGLTTGHAPDRFLVGLAVLSLLAEVAEERPLVCLIDDAQWLDRASAQALGFVARRLLAESVGVIFAVRTGAEERDAAGLPELVVEGLREDDARTLLDSVIRASGLQLPDEALRDAARETDEEIRRQVEGSEEILEVVQALERQYDAFAEGAEREGLLADGSQPMPTADELGAQFEQFLAEQQGRADSPDP